MAVVSEGTFYQAKIAPSYVSSSGYYGYVPQPCPIADYANVVQRQAATAVGGGVGEANDHHHHHHHHTAAATAASTGGHDWTTLSMPAMQRSYYQQQLQRVNGQQELISFNGSAMETDDDDKVRVSRRENNRCVIPEVAGLARLNGGGGNNIGGGGGVGGGFGSIYRVTQEELAAVAAAARLRGNRKRNSAGDPAYLFAGHPANNTKKPRQGRREVRGHRDRQTIDGGNGDVRHGARRPGKCGPAAMHNDPAPLNGTEDVGFSRRVRGSSSPTLLGGCLQAAGNYDSTGDSDLERPCNAMAHDKRVNGRLDYERMLMETHGCSAYHYYRHQHLDFGVLEAEF